MVKVNCYIVNEYQNSVDVDSFCYRLLFDVIQKLGKTSSAFSDGMDDKLNV